MVFQERLRIPAVLENVVVACDFVVEAARRAGLADRAVDHCQLAVDEACTNIIEHGYNYDGADQAIDIICQGDNRNFSITVIDDSPAFDPLGVEEPDPDAPLEEREPGGWGVFFIKQFMDEVSYTYASNRNTLTMVKLIGVPDQRSKLAKSASRERIAVTSPNKKTSVITLRGRFDGDISAEVEQILNKQLTSGSKFLVLDLVDVDYISSNGLKTVVTICRRAREANGDLMLAGLRPRVWEILEITGLDMILTVYRTAADAIASIPSE